MTEITTSARQIRWAPVLAALVTTASMIFAVTTYWQGAREHRQASVIGILQDYLKFTVEHPELASRPADAHSVPATCGLPRTRCSRSSHSG
jgi:hypothetical protein